MSCPIRPHCAEAEFEATRRMLKTVSPLQRALYLCALRRFREEFEQDHVRRP